MKTGINFAYLASLACCLLFLAACSPSGHALNSASKDVAANETGDADLDTLVKNIAPKFEEAEFTGSAGKKLGYWLFKPENLENGKAYPLVLFMADASAAGGSESPLSQYGALVWADTASQARHPCFVLVPKFGGAAVNGAYKRTPEVNMVLELLNELAGKNPVDSERLYATGQSMGGMIAMYYNIAHPEIFAASLFVDSHWDTASFNKLVKQNFIFIAAGDKGKSYSNIEAMENAARKSRRAYTFASWSAKLPQERQNELAETMLLKGAPINIFQFEPGTVLPDGGQGSEHIYSFEHAYKLTPCRDWLFNFVKK